MNADDVIKKTQEPIAFILSRYFTSDLGVIRSLKKKNIPTIVLTPNNKSISCYSRYYTGIRCPHAKNNENQYIEFLITLGEKLNNKGVLLPVGDIEVSVIFKLKSKLEQYYAFPPVDFHTVEKLLNKKRFYETLMTLDIPHPATYLPRTQSELETISREIQYPCMLKPVLSDYFRSEFHTKLFIVNSKEELLNKYETSALKNHEVLIQEIIPGGVRNHYGFNAYYDRNRQPNGSIMYRRIREFPHKFGNGCLIENIWEPELEEITTKLMKNIGYTGIIDAEFKKDAQNNTYKIIEVNPRCWMQVSLPTSCGINFPYLAYMDAIGKDFEKPMFNGKQVKWLFFVEDLFSSWIHFKKKELSLNQWLHSYTGKKEYAVFSWDDPLPFFALMTRLYTIYR